jgi:AsmA protein
MSLPFSDKGRLLRHLLICLAAVLALIIVVLAVPLIVPSNFMAAQIASIVRQKTGRDLHISGPISFSVLPRFALVAHDVKLANPSGFSGNFLSVKTVDVGLKALALLHGSIEIDQLRLFQPMVDFEVEKDGRRNWVFHPSKPTLSATPTARGSVALSFVTGNVTIVSGEASYLDRRDGPKRSVNDLNMTLSLPSLNVPLKAAGSAVHNGDPIKLAVTIVSPAELRDGRVSAAMVHIVTSIHGSLDFLGEIAGSDMNHASGTIRIAIPSLRNLLDWAQIGLLKQDKNLGPVTINGKIDGDAAKLTLADATIQFDQVTAKGTYVLTRSRQHQELHLDGIALYGGTGGGKIVVDEAGPTPTVSVSFDLTGITVHDVSFNIAGFDKLSGTGDVSVNLAAAGSTTRDLIASLNGSGRMNFTNGTIRSAGQTPLMKISPVISDNTTRREIEYRSLSASATIVRGVLHNSDLKLVGPWLSATGGGTLDLGPRQIDYLWQPDIAGIGSARIAITGDWDNPQYKVQSVTITKDLVLPRGLKLR